MNRVLYASLFILLFRLPTQAQQLSPDQLQTDFARFRAALAEAHPEMYRYTPKPRFDSLFAATASQLNKPMTQQAFYVSMVPLLVALRDGHIKWIVSGRDEHYPFSTDRLFPLKLYFLGSKAWIVGNYGSTPVPVGAEVMSINGEPMAAIIQSLLPNMTFADGDRTGGKLEDLNSYFSGYYATFIGAPDSFQVAWRSGADVKTVRLAPVTESMIKAYREQHKAKSQNPFRLTISENQTAVLTIERFWNEKNEPDFRPFLSESFRTIKQQGIQHLVLDLRNNEGGEESWGVELYSYLAQRPFRYYDHISVRQKKGFSFPAWSSKLYRMAKWIVVKKRGNGYVMTHHRGLRTTKPKADAYAGKLYVLLNGNSFSVTTELGARIHADKRAVFIGQESGGGYKVNSSGIFAITQLPNSKIDLGIGMFGFNMANVSAYPYSDRGIIPDYPVEPTAEDVIHQHDPVMEFTLKHIRSQTPALTKDE